VSSLDRVCVMSPPGPRPPVAVAGAARTPRFQRQSSTTENEKKADDNIKNSDPDRMHIVGNAILHYRLFRPHHGSAATRTRTRDVTRLTRPATSRRARSSPGNHLQTSTSRVTARAHIRRPHLSRVPLCRDMHPHVGRTSSKVSLSQSPASLLYTFAATGSPTLPLKTPVHV
jgi:hypothetical protein